VTVCFIENGNNCGPQSLFHLIIISFTDVAMAPVSDREVRAPYPRALKFQPKPIQRLPHEEREKTVNVMVLARQGREGGRRRRRWPGNRRRQFGQQEVNMLQRIKKDNANILCRQWKPSVCTHRRAAVRRVGRRVRRGAEKWPDVEAIHLRCIHQWRRQLILHIIHSIR
jgi:hypothetical protein